MTNTAMVQIIQCLVVLFWLLWVVAFVNARLRLPHTKIEPVLDVVMVLTILVYALVLKIFFST